MSRPRRFDWLFRPQMADEDLPLSAEARFAEALAELPAVERSALALSEIGGLDTNEIAQRLGTDPAVVRKLLLRARESVRASLSMQGRRGLAALLPFQNVWQSSGPAVRAAGVVVAAVVAPTVVIGGASADAPRATLTSPDPPHVRALEIVDRPVPVRSPVVDVVATAAAAVAPARRPAPPPARGERRSVRPGAGLQRDDASFVASVPAQWPVPSEPAERAEPAAAPEHPAPPQRPPHPANPSETVAGTVPRQGAAVPPPLPVPPPPPVELPVEPPPLPVEPPPLPPLPVPPPAPAPPPLP